MGAILLEGRAGMGIEEAGAMTGGTRESHSRARCRGSRRSGGMMLLIRLRGSLSGSMLSVYWRARHFWTKEVQCGRRTVLLVSSIPSLLNECMRSANPGYLCPEI